VKEQDKLSMRSPRGFLATIVFLLALPIAVLCQVLFGSGSGVVVHLALALGSVLLSFAVFDFRLPGWMNWIGCVSAAALGAIFLLQGVALLIHSDPLTYVAYQVLGQWPEGLFPALLILWFVAMLVFDSQGKMRILGFGAMSIVVGFEVYRYTLAYLGTSLEAQPQMSRLLLLLPFVWLLFESRKKPEDVAPQMRSSSDVAPSGG
jgi:hypothetical protein